MSMLTNPQRRPPVMERTPAPPQEPATAQKWVYLFSEGNAQMRDLLGGKGAGIAEMTRTGVPVPPGFTITTEACNAYYQAGRTFPPGMWEQVLEALVEVARRTGRRFGHP